MMHAENDLSIAAYRKTHPLNMDIELKDIAEYTEGRAYDNAIFRKRGRRGAHCCEG